MWKVTEYHKLSYHYCAFSCSQTSGIPVASWMGRSAWHHRYLVELLFDPLHCPMGDASPERPSQSRRALDVVLPEKPVAHPWSTGLGDCTTCFWRSMGVGQEPQRLQPAAVRRAPAHHLQPARRRHSPPSATPNGSSPSPTPAEQRLVWRVSCVTAKAALLVHALAEAAVGHHRLPVNFFYIDGVYCAMAGRT